MLKVAIGMTAVLLSTATMAQESPPTAPKPSGHYLPKLGATAEDFRRDIAGCEMRAEIAAPLGPIANFEANMAAVVSQKRIIATCMRANGWTWTTEATPTNIPPPTANPPPAAAAAPKSKPPPATAARKPSEHVAGSTAAERVYATGTPEALALRKVLFARRLDDYSTNDPAWRASLADALHRYCESVLMQVPRNTPEQDRWVDSEMKFFEGDSAQRFKRVKNSVEYARQNLWYVLSGCSSLAKNLIELKPTTPIKEALLWLRLSDYIVSSEVVLPLAEIAGLVSPKYYCNDEEHPPGAHDENNLCSWSFVHISIIRYAVIPLLEGSGGQ